EFFGQLRRSRRAAEALRKLRRCAAQAQMQLLESPRHLHRPAVVTEVPSNLTHDRGHRKRHEIRSGVDVESDHRVDQPHPRNLDEVVSGFPPTVETAGDMVGQWKTALDDPVALALESGS